MSLLASCKYDSEKMGVQSPNSTSVADLTIYNVDMLNIPSLAHLVVKEMSANENKADQKHLSTLFYSLVPRLLKTDFQ